MTRSFLRTAIIVLTLITAMVHLILLNINFVRVSGAPDLLFTLNGLGYLVLLGALFIDSPFLVEMRRWVYLVFMGYTFVTIAAYLAVGGGLGDPVGVFTKIVEVLLVIALWLHMRQTTT